MRQCLRGAHLCLTVLLRAGTRGCASAALPPCSLATCRPLSLQPARPFATGTRGFVSAALAARLPEEFRRDMQEQYPGSLGARVTGPAC